MQSTTDRPRLSLTSDMLWILGGAVAGAALLVLVAARGWMPPSQAWLLALAVPPGLIALELLRWGIVRRRGWMACLWPEEKDLAARRWIQFFAGMWVGGGVAALLRIWL